MSLQVWLPLNGNLNNQGTANVTITNNGATIDNAGKIGKCYSFDNSFIQTSVPSTINEISFSCWVYFNVQPTGIHLVDARDLNNASWGYQPFYCYNNGIEIGVINSSTPNYTSLNFTWQTGVWYNIITTYNSDGGKTYINGSLIGVSTTAKGYNFNRNLPVYIGRRHSPQGYLNGKLNDIRIYDTCLTIDQVRRISQGLVLHYPLNDKYLETTTNFLSDKTLQGHGSSWTLLSETFQGYPIYKNVVTAPNTWNNAGFRYSGVSNITLTNGTATISFWKKLNTVYGHEMNGYIRLQDSSGNQHSFSWNYNKSNWVNDSSSIGKWEYITGTANISNYSSMTNFVVFYVYMDNATGGDCDFSQIQIELSKNHATPYTTNSRNNTIVYDISGFNNNGIINDTTAIISSDSKRYSCSTKNNQASNSGTYLCKGKLALSDIDSLTISFWAKPSSIGHQDSGIFSTTAYSRPTDYQATAMHHYDARIACTNTSGTVANLSVGNQFTLNEWHHYLWKYDGTNCYFYKDNVLITSVAQTGKLKPFTSIFPFYAEAGGAKRCTSGLINDLRIYATALSADDIKELYEMGHN